MPGFASTVAVVVSAAFRGPRARKSSCCSAKTSCDLSLQRPTAHDRADAPGIIDTIEQH